MLGFRRVEGTPVDGPAAWPGEPEEGGSATVERGSIFAGVAGRRGLLPPAVEGGDGYEVQGDISRS